MELLSSANMFNSAFLGLPASLIGFLLLLFWGGMIILGMRVDRAAYKMIGIVLTTLCLSMLLGLYDVGARTGSNAGGIFGQWVAVRCAGSGVLALVYLLLWIAFPTGLLLATDWLFFRYLFGRQKPLLAASGASDFFAEGKKLVNSLGFLRFRPIKFRPKPKWKKKTVESDLVADVETMSSATAVETKQELETDYTYPSVRPMGSSSDHEMPHTETWRSGWGGEEAELADEFDGAGVDEDVESPSDEAVIRLTAVAEPEVENASDEAIESEAAEALDRAGWASRAGWAGGVFGPALETEEEPLPSSSTSVSDDETAETSDDTTWWKSDSLSEERAATPESDATDAVSPETDEIEEPDVTLDKSWWTPPAEPLESAAQPSDDLEEHLEEELEEDVENEPDDADSEEAGSEDEAETYEAPVEEQESGPYAESIVDDGQIAAVEQSESEITSDDEEVEEDQMERLEVEESVVEESAVTAEEVTTEAVIDTAIDGAHDPEPQAEFSFDAPQQTANAPEINEEEERLFKNAVSVVVREKKGSISLLQKELGLGYFRAAKLLNILESRNVIAPYAGSIARKVVISDEEAERIASE